MLDAVSTYVDVGNFCCSYALLDWALTMNHRLPRTSVVKYLLMSLTAKTPVSMPQ